ncbi:hypothetical protein V6N13_023079 [Hibiscus sabdariffa]|uniref:J domain-containing protein n=1 Tax=Hibiscus sabdariffa TaxID=183260 RepID=A0ABR2BY66_9ROSI
MDCNKEEAIRARDIAEQKMQNKDFSGALRVAAKAQQLYPDLENISQMIVVCDVHCAAEKRLFGDVMDWYAILKVEPTADETTIKKQYRKFAFQLHPDKNKFPGAEAAFKLIGDAQRTLLDQGKRSTHDMKRKVTVNRPSPAAACRPPQNPSRYPHAAAQNNFCSNFPGVNSQQQPQPPTKMGFTNGRSTFWTKCPYCMVKYQYYTEILNRSINCQSCKKTFSAYDSGVVPLVSNMCQPIFPQKGVAQNQGARKVDQESQRNFTTEHVFTAFTPNVDRASEAGMRKVNGKRGRKQTVESNESCNESEEDVVIEGDGDHMARKFNSQVEQNVRRSGKRKQHVSYKDNLSAEGDDLQKPGKSNVDGLKENINPIVDDSVSDTSFKETKEPLLFAYPDPEFHDFDNAKKESCFSVGQVWALYDTLDAMPRFYAQIRKIFSSGFKLRITWLEPDPDDANEIEWVSEGTCRDTYKIFPRKGETWALFKNWNINWKSGACTDKKFEYEFVEILSDVAEGAEGQGVLKGSFELDTASLPEEIVGMDLKANGDSRHLNSSFSSASETLKPIVGSEKPAPPASASKTFAIPESESYNFDADKSQDKFLVGQVWALYGDDDGLPKYYGEITKIESHPVFKIHSLQVRGKNIASHLEKARYGHYIRNWSPEIKCSDLEYWQYDIVLVMEETNRCIEALNLERVDGFNSVFKAQVKGGSNVTVEISRVDQLRFSHQIPFFQLTKERNGRLRGCWELDPAATPVHYFSS